MYNIGIVSKSNVSRREVLLSLMDILNNPEELKSIAGTNAVIDCGLYMMAKDDEKLLRNLNVCLDTDELQEDIKHIRRSSELKTKIKEMRT